MKKLRTIESENPKNLRKTKLNSEIKSTEFRTGSYKNQNV